MNNSPARPVSPWVSKESLLALLMGGVLGQLVSDMAERRPDDMFSFAMAVVCVLAASASLVSYLLSRPQAPGRASRARQVPAWVLAIGAGLLLVLQASPL